MLTAAENIVLPLKLAGVKPDQAWLDELVASVGLTDRLDHRPSELSGGQQQRVAVARALVSRPSVMFADEPTGNLDSTTSGEILGLLRDSVDTLGQTTVMVTHDAHAAAIADRVLFLADGDIVRDLGPSTRARDPRDARAGERSMIGVALKGLAGRKIRALLTALAVVIGVSMVSGTYILTDTMQKSFNGLFTASYDKTDAVIQRQGDRQGLHQRQRRHHPRVAPRRGPGAARGRGRRRRGLPAGGQRRRHHRRRRQDRRPRERRRQLRRRQLALQPAQAQVGRVARRARSRSSSTPAPPPSSTTSVGDDVVDRDGRRAAHLRAHRHRHLRRRRLARLRAASRPGTSRPRRRCSTARAATTRSRSRRKPAPRRPSSSTPSSRSSGDTLQVKDSAKQAKDDADELERARWRSAYFLLGFGGIALLVGAFVIFNTLSITVAQRTREFATLRTLGASRKQVMRSVMLEGLVIGLLASVIGLVRGHRRSPRA